MVFFKVIGWLVSLGALLIGGVLLLVGISGGGWIVLAGLSCVIFAAAINPLARARTRFFERTKAVIFVCAGSVVIGIIGLTLAGRDGAANTNASAENGPTNEEIVRTFLSNGVPKSYPNKKSMSALKNAIGQPVTKRCVAMINDLNAGNATPGGISDYSILADGKEYYIPSQSDLKVANIFWGISYQYGATDSKQALRDLDPLTGIRTPLSSSKSALGEREIIFHKDCFDIPGIVLKVRTDALMPINRVIAMSKNADVLKQLAKHSK